MVVSQRRTLMTADELFDLPDDHWKYELVKGELIRMSPTGAEHGALTARVGRILDEYAEAQRSGVCCGAETGFILQRDPDVVRAPDAAFVTADRVPTAGLPKSFWPFAPDLAVEVASPSDRFSDLHTKVAEFFSAGTRLVWIVEPATRTVYVYRSPHDVQALAEHDQLSGADVLPGFRCAVGRLFS